MNPDWSWKPDGKFVEPVKEAPARRKSKPKWLKKIEAKKRKERLAKAPRGRAPDPLTKEQRRHLRSI